VSWLSQVLNLFHRKRIDEKLDEEPPSHLDARSRVNLNARLNAETAEHDARRRFGNGTLGLAFSNPPASVTLIAGSGGTVSFVLANSGGLASSGTTTVIFALNVFVTFNPTGSGGSGWDCSASTST
jgi:hypothetical protein